MQAFIIQAHLFLCAVTIYFFFVILMRCLALSVFKFRCIEIKQPYSSCYEAFLSSSLSSQYGGAFTGMFSSLFSLGIIDLQSL